MKFDGLIKHQDSHDYAKELAEHLSEIPIRKLAKAGVNTYLVYKFIERTK